MKTLGRPRSLENDEVAAGRDELTDLSNRNMLGAFVWSRLQVNLLQKGTSIYEKRELEGRKSTKKCNKAARYCLMLTKFLQFADIA